MSSSEPTDHKSDTVSRDAEAWKAGARRASAHFLRAGYEILAGINALLEEVGPGVGATDGEGSPPQRIEVE